MPINQKYNQLDWLSLKKIVTYLLLLARLILQDFFNLCVQIVYLHRFT